MAIDLNSILIDEIKATKAELESQNNGTSVLESVYKNLFDKAQPVLENIAEIEDEEEKINTLLQCIRDMVNNTGQKTVNFKNQIAKLQHKILILESLEEKFTSEVEREKKSEELNEQE